MPTFFDSTADATEASEAARGAKLARIIRCSTCCGENPASKSFERDRCSAHLCS